jgi:hypothetical protein
MFCVYNLRGHHHVIFLLQNHEPYECVWKSVSDSQRARLGFVLCAGVFKKLLKITF